MNILEEVLGGAADVTVYLRALDTDGLPMTVSHDTSGIDLWYMREGAAQTNITEVALAALTTAHTDGGVEPVDDGYFRLDLPDAAVAAGVRKCLVGGTVTGGVIIGGAVLINGYDRTATPPEIGDLVADWADGGRLDLLLDQLIADFEDAAAEPGQGAPAANASRLEKLDYLYKLKRNKSDNDGSEIKHYADDGTTVDHKRTVADDGSTATIGELVTGA